jgi:hypothetical protein
MPRLELLPGEEKRGLVDVSVDPVAVLKVVVEKRVDGVHRGKGGGQIAVVVAGRLVARCFFGRSSRPRTLLWRMIEICALCKSLNCDRPSTADWQRSWVQHNIRGGRACHIFPVCFPLQRGLFGSTVEVSGQLGRWTTRIPVLGCWMCHGTRDGSREGIGNAECKRFQWLGRHCWPKKQVFCKQGKYIRD